MSPQEALADNKKYKVVQQVLHTLRAHDERVNAMVNKLELNRAQDDNLQMIGVEELGVIDSLAPFDPPSRRQPRSVGSCGPVVEPRVSASP